MEIIQPIHRYDPQLYTNNLNNQLKTPIKSLNQSKSTLNKYLYMSAVIFQPMKIIVAYLAHLPVEYVAITAASQHDNPSLTKIIFGGSENCHLSKV